MQGTDLSFVSKITRGQTLNALNVYHRICNNLDNGVEPCECSFLSQRISWNNFENTNTSAEPGMTLSEVWAQKGNWKLFADEQKKWNLYSIQTLPFSDDALCGQLTKATKNSTPGNRYHLSDWMQWRLEIRIELMTVSQYCKGAHQKEKESDLQYGVTSGGCFFREYPE